MLTRIKIVPSRKGVRVISLEPAAKGNEKLVGTIECRLADLPNLLKTPEVQQILGLDKQPKRRVR